ncbi:MAG: VanZ family protein [Bacteroidota bacterium]
MIDYDGKNKLTISLFVIYLIALVWILLFKLGAQFSYIENREVNFIPFGTTLLNGKIDFIETFMNIVIFIPLGIYNGIFLKGWAWKRKIFFFFLISLVFEAIQFIFKLGAFDITDTITNTFGGTIGLILFITIEKGLKNSSKAQKLINIVATIGTFLMILFLLLLKTNNLWIRYQ